MASGSGRHPIERWWRDEPPAPLPVRALLAAASLGYRGGRALHRALYATKLLVRRRLPVPVASVGNLTVGGTGKTPFVAWLARELSRRGLRVLVLGRGYGRRPGAPLNDEGEWLALQGLPGVRVIQAPDRFAAATAALATEPADLVLLDDGFQHEPLERDLDVVLIDARDPFGNGRLLPRGPLREPVSGLARAQFVFATRAELVEAGALEPLRQAVLRLAPGSRFGVVRFEIRSLRRGNVHEPVDVLRGRRFVLLTGVARPDLVFESAEAAGGLGIGEVSFPDHHEFTRAELEDAEQSAREDGAELVVTEKDAVKLDRLGGAERRLVLEQEVVVDAMGAELIETLARLAGRRPASVSSASAT